MIFNDCSKAETKKKPPEEERELTPQEIYDTMLRPELDKVHEWLDKVHEWLRENFETQPQAMENDAETEKKHEEEQDTQREVSLEKW